MRLEDVALWPHQHAEKYDTISQNQYLAAVLLSREPNIARGHTDEDFRGMANNTNHDIIIGPNGGAASTSTQKVSSNVEQHFNTGSDQQSN